jgi:hypothetical protein
MWNDDENEDDFFNDMNSVDPVDSAMLREIWEAELEKSMRFAFSMIEEMGVDRWATSIPFNKERKLRILDNMLDWHVQREEYEKCSILKKGIDKLQSIND